MYSFPPTHSGTPPGSSAGNISVGGPAGIHILNHPPVIPVGQNPQERFAEPLRAAQALHPKLIAGCLGLASVFGFVTPIVVISAFGLPWLLYVVPALASSVALVIAIFLWGRALTGSVKGLPAASLEPLIVDEAIRSGGRLTTTRLAHALKIPLAQADEVLSQLAKAGYVDLEVDPTSGVVVYVFRDIAANPNGMNPRLGVGKQG
jgi:hypothetical protein